MTAHPPSYPLTDLPDAAITVASDGRIEAVNRPAREMLLLEPGAELPPLPTLLTLPAEFEHWLGEDGSRDVLRLRVDARRMNGVPFAADLSARRRADGGALCLLRELAGGREGGEAQRYFDIAFETAPIGMALFNTDGEYTRVNAALCRMLDRGDDELLGRRDQEFTHPEDRQADIDAAWRILAGEIHTWQCEKRFLRPDGSILWTIANLTFLRDEEGHPLSWVGQFQDITDRKQREAELSRLADHDPLTGLLNRRGFERGLEEMIASRAEGAILLVDLDRFKKINDSFGHRAGDQALTAVAEAIADNLRGEDVLARIGGDEFAVILRGAHGDAAQAVADDLVGAIAGLGFEFDPRAALGASIGIGLIERERDPTLDSVLNEADLAMYRVKHRTDGGGKGEVVQRRRRSDWLGARESEDRDLAAGG